MRADTVIVGAGSSGVVIAARATERADREVLLLEAGPDYAPGTTLPTDLRQGGRNSMLSHDWGYWYRATPRHPLVYELPRGRVVGGSSAVNTCVALRGFPHDYDEWAALGLPEWSWEHCLPALLRLENDLDVVNEWHSQRGPTPIRRHPPAELATWQAAFLEGCASLGFAPCADLNDPEASGYGTHPMNKVDGERMSASRCYLTAAVRARPGLRIDAGVHVRRVLFGDGAQVHVRGLEIERDGRVETIDTERVVLAAGAIATPGILMRSGIGPRRAIEALGVTLVSDVPAVGARLLDHPGSAILLAPRAGVQRMNDPLLQVGLRYTSRGSTFPTDMILQPGSVVPLPHYELPLVSIMCSIGKPRGVGRISWTSADAHAKPRVDYDFLADASDRAKAMEAMELAWLCATSPPMRELAKFALPLERVLMRRESMEKWIPTGSGSGYHPCGTVPMGADDDAGAATDSRGRVRGVRGLVVADASLMPTIPTANINVSTLMIGERFGEWLRDGALWS